MIVINAVECKNHNVISRVVDKYLESNTCDKVYTDDTILDKAVKDKYGSESSICMDSMLGLVFSATKDCLLIITKFENVISSIFKTLEEEYSILVIESAEVY